MKVAIIGYGSIGARHAQNLQEMGIKPVVLTARRDLAGVDVVHSWKELALRGCLDAIFICNETHKHTDSILHALKLKPKGIFVEKPLAHTVRSATRIAHSAAKYRGVFFVGYSMQFFKPYMEIQKLLKSGVVGEPLSMRISVGQDLRAWRTRDYRKGYSADAKKGGGVVLDLIHEINIPSWILRGPLRFVAGAVGQLGDLKIKSEDTAESLFVSAKGVPVSVHQDYLAVPGHRYCLITGTRGTLIWEWVFGDSGPHLIHIHLARGSRTVRVLEPRGAMYKRELKAFLDRVRKGARYTNLTEALLDIAHAEAIKCTKL